MLMRRIRFFGTDTPTGVGTHCSQTVKALQSFEFENIQIQLIKHNFLDEVQAAFFDSSASDVNIFSFPELYAKNLNGIKIYWCEIDASRPHSGYEQWLDTYDYIFAGSHWCRDAMQAYGMDVSKIIVVPEGVDSKFYQPYDRPVAPSSEKTKFLMVGKYEKKKGYQEAFEALAIAAERGASIELITKSDWINGTTCFLPDEFIHLVKRHQGNFSMVIYGGNFSREQMLLACPASVLAKFRIMVIEFHAVESWDHGDFLNIVEATFTKLLRSHFIVHSHPNNAMGLVDMNGFVAPRIFELTLLSRSRAAPGAIAATPHPLDFPNVNNMPPLDWNQCWVPRVSS